MKKKIFLEPPGADYFCVQSNIFHIHLIKTRRERKKDTQLLFLFFSFLFCIPLEKIQPLCDFFSFIFDDSW